MKYDITYACGHTATVEIYGPAAERERKARWYATIDCPDCYNAIGCTPVQMLYRDYKATCPEYRTKKDSYDPETKTITVYVPNDTETTKEEEPEMTTEEFVREATHRAGAQYMACFAVDQAEATRIVDEVRQDREAGHSFIPSESDPYGLALGFASTDLHTDEEELEAAAELLRTAPLKKCIETYHRQLTREHALMMLNGAYLTTLQPGACWLDRPGLICAFPGYSALPETFARAWNAANPDQSPIYPPDPDLG